MVAFGYLPLLKVVLFFIETEIKVAVITSIACFNTVLFFNDNDKSHIFEVLGVVLIY